ncbi:Phenylacetic acid degradation-related domain-containing protein [Artemisia annua]|uniref:Phenylacetic acid degradation-related domain-containing protein n=1 Tax=Artemisia annua TaxID=35608 RepID=A0A2U1Q0L5_ARTAN|nr:Phenylacetic acid degradation-related domain-containing protein [Artemisia annua]
MSVYKFSQRVRAAKHLRMVTTVLSNEASSEAVARVTKFLVHDRGAIVIPEKLDGEGVNSDVIRSLIKVKRIDRGHVSCIVTVKPYACNVFNTLFGGAVGSIAEFVAIACARTVVNEDKELFLGELNVSFLAPAVNQICDGETSLIHRWFKSTDLKCNFFLYDQAEVMVDASVVRSGRNLTIVAIEFKLKDTERLTYLCRATFYNMPVASL